MKNKLFISNLDFEVDGDQLRTMFESLGPTVSVVIAKDRDTKRSKGFAFIEMQSDADAKKAVEELNNKMINGRPMKVAFDKGKPDAGGQEPREAGDSKRRFEPLPPIQRTQLFRRKRRLDPFTSDPTKVVDYKDVAILSKYVSERGKILSRKLTGLTAYHQRQVAKAIKRAQALGLMPYSKA